MQHAMQGEGPEGQAARLDQLLAENPYDAYAMMAEEDVFWHERTESWYVTSEARVREMLSDRRFVARGASPLDAQALVSGSPQTVEQLEAFLGRWPAFSDDEQVRTAVRALRRRFSPAQAEAIRPRIRLIAEELARRADPARVIATFAGPLARATLGVVLDVDESTVNDLRDRTGAVISYLVNDGQDLELARRANQEVTQMVDWVEKRRQRATDIIAAAMREAGLDVSGEDLAALYMQVVTGTLDPVQNTLASAVAFLDSDDVARQWSADGRFDLVLDAALQNDVGFHFAPRRAGCPIAFADKEINAGERVVGVLAHVARAQDLKDSKNSRPSFAFGYGRHFCLGVNVAYVVMEEALAAIWRHHLSNGAVGIAIEKLPALGASVYRDSSGGDVHA